MVIGGIEFNIKEVSKMSYSEFEKVYKGKLKGVDIKDASKMLGIKEKKVIKKVEKEIKEGDK